MNNKELVTLLKDSKIYYQPNPGNGGDALIASGAFQFFKHNNIDFVIIDENTDISDKVVCYAGAGNLVSDYPAAADFIDKWHNKVRKLIVLPHTINGHQQLLTTVKDNVYFFCREEISFQYVKTAVQAAHVSEGDDLALELLPEMYVANFSSNYPVKLFIKQCLKKIKSKQYFSGFRVLNAFRNDIEKTDIALPNDNIDVSNAINYNSSMNNEFLANRTTADIFKFLGFYKVINTNRLHIAIAGALLGKEVNFYPNSYYKNEAIYNKSLTTYVNVKFHMGEKGKSA